MNTRECSWQIVQSLWDEMKKKAWECMRVHKKMPVCTGKTFFWNKVSSPCFLSTFKLFLIKCAQIFDEHTGVWGKTGVFGLHVHAALQDGHANWKVIVGLVRLLLGLLVSGLWCRSGVVFAPAHEAIVPPRMNHRMRLFCTECICTGIFRKFTGIFRKRPKISAKSFTFARIF